jgi:hypothetical protein
MKNRKREICTSGSVRDEAGQPPHLLGGLVSASTAKSTAVQKIHFIKTPSMVVAPFSTSL